MTDTQMVLSDAVVLLGIIAYLLSLFFAAYWWRDLVCRSTPIIYVNAVGFLDYLLAENSKLSSTLLANLVFTALTAAILGGIWYEHYRPEDGNK
jgi:hypothetical protein